VNSLRGYCSLNSDWYSSFFDWWLLTQSEQWQITVHSAQDNEWSLFFFFLIIRNINFIIIFLNYCSVNSDIYCSLNSKWCRFFIMIPIIFLINYCSVNSHTVTVHCTVIDRLLFRLMAIYIYIYIYIYI